MLLLVLESAHTMNMESAHTMDMESAHAMVVVAKECWSLGAYPTLEDAD